MKYRILFLSIIISTLYSLPQVYGQQGGNNLNVRGSETIVDTIAQQHSPKKAAIFSAIIPGLGQVYNKKYWKVPIIYAGFTVLTYYIVENNAKYIKFRNAYRQRVDDNPNNDNILTQYTNENLRTIKDLYWKNRDLSVILVAVLYTMNILDAVVDAHFFTFDISDDLSLHISPTTEPSVGLGTSPTAALSFSLNF